MGAAVVLRQRHQCCAVQAGAGGDRQVLDTSQVARVDVRLGLGHLPRLPRVLAGVQLAPVAQDEQPAAGEAGRVHQQRGDDLFQQPRGGVGCTGRRVQQHSHRRAETAAVWPAPERVRVWSGHI